jgi:hypothetical protein
MKSRLRALALLGCVFFCGACNVKSVPPRHALVESAASAVAKAELVELVVSDPDRAQRLQRIYLAIAALGYEAEMRRAQSAEGSRLVLAGAGPAAARAERVTARDLELVLAPPLDESRGAFERYVGLVLEARALLREDEFERLRDVR